MRVQVATYAFTDLGHSIAVQGSMIAAGDELLLCHSASETFLAEIGSRTISHYRTIAYDL